MMLRNANAWHCMRLPLCANLTATPLVVCPWLLTLRTQDPASIGLTERRPDTRASRDAQISVGFILL